MEGDVRVFDVPYWKGPAELIHLLSVISPVADDLAVVYLPLLPAGLWELLNDLDVRLVTVPDEEFPTLGCNVLAVRPGVVILAEGNPGHQRRPRRRGLRGAHLSGRSGRGQRLRRPDVHDPAHPSWLTVPAVPDGSSASGRPAAFPDVIPDVDSDRLLADLQALVRSRA